MYKIFLFLFLFLGPLKLISQYKIDTIIKTKAYTAYINKKLKQVVYVKYELHNGGGDCKRVDRWINDSKLDLINDKQYKHSNFDKGHLANAEDFAYDCSLNKLTFRYYNRLPQTEELNRGIWKTDEKEIRDASLNDNLIVYCGGYWGDKLKYVNTIPIPIKCWKIVFSKNKNKIIYSYILENNHNPIKKKISLVDLEKLINLKLK